MSKKSPQHYVDNKRLNEELIKYCIEYRRCKEEDIKLPRANDYIGSCILKICNGLGFRFNFVSYSYRDEMIGDAILNCIKVIKNFDPAKSSNPFAYLSQIAYFAMIRKIKQEKKLHKIKYSLMANFNADDLNVGSMNSEDQNNYGELIGYLNSVGNSKLDEEDYTAPPPRNKRKPKSSGYISLETFIE